MKLLPTCLFALLLAQVTFAQQSIGFSDSTNFNYLIDYRFPSWGYSQFSLVSGSLNLDGRNDNTEYQLNDENNPRTREQNQFIGEFSITPRYEFFRQGEKRILNISTSATLTPRLDRNRSLHSQIGDNDEQVYNNKGSRINNELTMNLLLKEYLVDDFFIRPGIETSGAFQFRESKTERSEEDNISEYFYRDLSMNIYFGIGYGRIRNVTPVIRALRTNERYKALGNQSLTSTEIIAAAEQFTRFNGYSRSYDRPLKYFWQDMDQLVNNKFSSLSTFDQFYLNEIFEENLGSRFEGYEVTATASYTYFNTLNREEFSNETDIERIFTILRAAEIEFSGNYYKNLNLNHQIRLTTNLQTFFPLERVNDYEYVFNPSLSGNWLWVLEDRWLLTNSITGNLRLPSRKESEEYREYNLSTSIRSNLTYFAENRLAITSSLRFSSVHDRFVNLANDFSDSSNRYLWSVRISIQYFFTRNLF